MISLFTLNLWRYNDFEKRLENVVSTIKEKQPDVIFLQEVQIDTRLSSFSQVEIIKEMLSEYTYSVHSTIYPKESQSGEKLDTSLQHGMAILSKFPIINSFEYYVPRNEGESEPRSILCFDIKKEEDIFKLANIHLANKEQWAVNQLKDFLAFIHSRNEARILAGDFNMYGLPKYKKLTVGYNLSFDFKEYISMPKDNWCLDYVLIPKNMEFSLLEVIDTYLSDHRGLFVTIKESSNKTRPQLAKILK